MKPEGSYNLNLGVAEERVVAKTLVSNFSQMTERYASLTFRCLDIWCAVSVDRC